MKIERIRKNMDRYKKTIKIRIGLLSIPLILVIALCVYYALFASDQVMENSIFCFQVGLITPLGLAATILIIRYRALLKDENKLLLQFNKENDERTKAIKAKAGIPMLPITSTLMIIAGVIAGYSCNACCYSNCSNGNLFTCEDILYEEDVEEVGMKKFLAFF